MSDETQNVKLQKEDIIIMAKNDFIEYASEVILDRAIPDERDGLKPVHRRILYAMNNLGLTPSSVHKKSARVVGDIIGKYHPHGDAAVYLSMVRMSQDFSLRYPLVDGKGNWGSVDGDSAAAMRYTETKLTKIAPYIIGALKKDAVDYKPNFDETEVEPKVLASKLPNLLMNGTSGIAVGMATSIPPHNLTELQNAIKLLLQKPDATLDEVLEHIKGPDFPLGGEIINAENIKNIYEKGSGSVIIRSTANIDEKEQQIIITDVPYGVNKADTIAKIAEKIKDKEIEGISEIRDESSKEGIRIVIEYKRNTDPVLLLNTLYKKSDLQTNFAVNMTVLDKGKPAEVNLLHILHSFIDHLKEITIRTSKFERKEHLDRLELVEGELKVRDIIDKVIETIKQSKSTEESIANVKSLANLTDRQAKHIVDMRLSKLSSNNHKQQLDEVASLKEKISKLTDTIDNPNTLIKELILENEELTSKFGDARRTKLRENALLTNDDLVKDENSQIILTSNGFVRRQPLEDIKTQNKGGVGSSALSMYDGDTVFKVLSTSSKDDLLFFTTGNKVYRIKAYDIPETSKTSKGGTIQSILPIDTKNGEKVVDIINVKKDDYNKNKYILIYTKDGLAKRTELKEFESINKNGKVALSMNEGDLVKGVIVVEEGNTMFTTTSDGKSIHMNVDEVRASGRTSKGVNVQKLENNFLQNISQISKTATKLLILTDKGFGKKSLISEFGVKSRNGSGMKSISTDSQVVSVMPITNDKGVLSIITAFGNKVNIRLEDISTLGRVAKGSNIITLKPKDKIVDAIIIEE